MPKKLKIRPNNSKKLLLHKQRQPPTLTSKINLRQKWLLLKLLQKLKMLKEKLKSRKRQQKENNRWLTARRQKLKLIWQQLVLQPMSKLLWLKELQSLSRLRKKKPLNMKECLLSKKLLELLVKQDVRN